MIRIRATTLQSFQSASGRRVSCRLEFKWGDEESWLSDGLRECDEFEWKLLLITLQIGFKYVNSVKFEYVDQSEENALP